MPPKPAAPAEAGSKQVKPKQKKAPAPKKTQPIDDIDCTAGKFSAAGSAECDDCAAGKFSATIGATLCDDNDEPLASSRPLALPSATTALPANSRPPSVPPCAMTMTAPPASFRPLALPSATTTALPASSRPPSVPLKQRQWIISLLLRLSGTLLHGEKRGTKSSTFSRCKSVLISRGCKPQPFSPLHHHHRRPRRQYHTVTGSFDDTGCC
jgi:hypothetical protein